jgi:hypothetical protein
MGQRFKMAGRDICEWALALFRTVIAGVAVVAVIGSFKFYNDFTLTTSPGLRQSLRAWKNQSTLAFYRRRTR